MSRGKDSLRDYQLDAVQKMKNGCILCGGVGSGKSRTSIAYYMTRLGQRQLPLYIITTARKRDTGEWNDELKFFGLGNVDVDSWNNIKKYVDVEDSFFVFDEQRVVGSGVWVQSFLKIAKHNEWILLSATPGDCWMDYVPVFIANGFYKNRTEFIQEHVVYSRFSKYPMVDRYINTGILIKYRRSILVDMDFKRKTIAHHENITVFYDMVKYSFIMRNRFDPRADQPIRDAAGLCRCLRQVVNMDDSRKDALLKIFEQHPKLIVFYNFDYELYILKELPYGKNVIVAEWNGHRHDRVPNTAKFVYLVQYTAGCEGWNCIETDTMVFYSQNYSYKVMCQAAGRIDRLNTPFTDLYYYHLMSNATIDLAIKEALTKKKVFQESSFVDCFSKKKQLT